MTFTLDRQLGYNLNRTALLFRRELIRVLRPYSRMTPEQWQTLASLWEANHPLSPTEISRVTLQDLPSLSRMLRRMEEHGWIRKTPDENDMRSFRVELTPTGHCLKQKLPEKVLEHFRPFLAPLTRQEANQLLQLLNKLRQGFEGLSRG